MHVDVLNEDEFIVFLNNNRIPDIDFTNHEQIEKDFKNIFIILNKKYDIDINGYYSVKLYRNKFYGIILDIKLNDVDYIDYRDFFDNQIEMNIEVLDTDILYEVEDFFFLNKLENIDLYNYHNKLYISLKNKLDESEYLRLIEFSHVIYGLNAKKILSKGKKICK